MNNSAYMQHPSPLESRHKEVQVEVVQGDSEEAAGKSPLKRVLSSYVRERLLRAAELPAHQALNFTAVKPPSGLVLRIPLTEQEPEPEADGASGITS